MTTPGSPVTTGATGWYAEPLVERFGLAMTLGFVPTGSRVQLARQFSLAMALEMGADTEARIPGSFSVVASLELEMASQLGYAPWDYYSGSPLGVAATNTPVPANVSGCYVTVIGGGGGGGGGHAALVGETAGGGGGGGGGCASRIWIPVDLIGPTFSCQAGISGLYGTQGQAGQPGGTSNFIGAVVAGGGAGGGSGSVANVPPAAGGTAQSTVGGTVNPGGNGGNSAFTIPASHGLGGAGGGGGAGGFKRSFNYGNGGDGGNSDRYGAPTGGVSGGAFPQPGQATVPTDANGGAGGAGGAAPSGGTGTAQNGSNGGIFGGGAGGGGASGSGTGGTGGLGGFGLVRIEWVMRGTS